MAAPFSFFALLKIKQNIFNKENLESTDSHGEGN